MSESIQFLRTFEITGTIRVLTGLRIGGGKDTVEIGGIDNPVIKHPHTQRPYIPGSSIKGKIRSLMEWALNVVEDNGDVYGSNSRADYDAKDPVLRTFGTTHKSWRSGPTRLIVRDAALVEDWANSIINNGLPLTEEKMEVTINRLEGKAASMGPRTSERVPAGALFGLEMSFRQFAVDGDQGAGDRRCLNLLFQGMKLLEQDALGSSGSRGYGRICFEDLSLDGKPVQELFVKINRFDNENPLDFLKD